MRKDASMADKGKPDFRHLSEQAGSSYKDNGPALYGMWLGLVNEGMPPQHASTLVGTYYATIHAALMLREWG